MRPSGNTADALRQQQVTHVLNLTLLANYRLKAANDTCSHWLTKVAACTNPDSPELSIVIALQFHD